MYEVKINLNNEEGKGDNLQIALTNATSVKDAVAIIEGMAPGCEVMAAYLSQYREAYPYDVVEEGVALKWYDVTLVEPTGEGKKTIKSHMLVQAKSFDECYARMDGILQQGYGMTIKGIKESSVNTVSDMAGEEKGGEA